MAVKKGSSARHNGWNLIWNLLQPLNPYFQAFSFLGIPETNKRAWEKFCTAQALSPRRFIMKNLCIYRPDLPTCSYLSVLVRKSVGSMVVWVYFSKYGQSFQIVWKSRREQMWVHCQQTRSLSVGGVVVFWHLHILSNFWGWNVLIGQESLLNQWTSTLHSKLYGSRSSSDMVDLNSLPVTSCCTKPQKRKNARNQENKVWPDNNSSRNQQKLHTWCVAFVENVLQSLTWRTWADVNKIKASERHSVPVLQYVCMIENVSSHTLLTR